MTEDEWQKLTDPESLLGGVESNRRKLRLFAFACCCRVERWANDTQCQQVLTIIDLLAEGLVSEDERLAGANSASAVMRECEERLEESAGVTLSYLAAKTIWESLEFNPAIAANNASQCAAKVYGSISEKEPYNPFNEAFDAERSYQCRIIRDIFGNPFRPVAFEASWLTSTVLTLAHQMYESRDFSPMPILADALQDAGCDNTDILNHCRQPGEHVRGCWVIDLLLAKS